MGPGPVSSETLDRQHVPGQPVLEPQLDPAIHLGEPYASSERFHRPERDVSIPNAREADQFDFSFCEDDLIPERAAAFGGYEHTQHQVQAVSESSVYSRPSPTRRDSKISIERAILVSEDKIQDENTRQGGRQITAARGSPDAHIRRQSNSSPQRQEEPQTSRPRSLRLSRTLTSISRSARVSRIDSSPSKDADSADGARRSKLEVPGQSSTRADVEEGLRPINKSLQGTAGGMNSNTPELARSRSVLGRKFQSLRENSPFRQPSASSTDKSTVGSSPSRRPKIPLLKSFSNTSLPSMAFLDRFSSASSQTPAQSGINRSQLLPSSSKTKDELWSVFRNLDAEYSKFQSKSIALKTNVIRSSLLTFLREYRCNAADGRLQAEDLDRRTAILSKWWTGLLELLSTNIGLKSSGAERLIVQDAITGIMERPEWRVGISSTKIGAKSDRPERRPQSKDSTASITSDFVTESVFHNIRNTFAQNLSIQMRYVVERMTPTHASPSITSFCGRTCAYAFFFCPGVADTLVRVWNIKSSDLQRIARAFDIHRDTQSRDAASSVAMYFPRGVQALAFSSTKSMMQTLRRAPTTPFGLDQVQWYGNWIGRWCGRESDLFYAFAKQYHVLTTEMLPSSATRDERMCAPGLVLVAAQMLMNLEATVHRKTLQNVAESSGPDAAVTFDVLLAADATPNFALGPSINAARSIAENRLILLMKDIFRDADAPEVMLFADAFRGVLHCATKSTSLYDQNACFTLCDVLQEALVGLMNLENDSPKCGIFVDWSFWLNVFKRILQSHNTTSEIRLYSMLFAIWESLIRDEERLTRLISGLLLDENHFQRTFNHWCPMIRAYYMRLLCWRVARGDDHGASDVHLMVLQSLAKSLQKVWSHYGYLVQDADHDGLLLPSTAPCNPAPGRRLLIIRMDTSIMNNLMSIKQMMSSDGVDDWNERPIADENTDNGPSVTSASLLNRVVSSFDSGEKSRRTCGLFRSLLGYGASENSSKSESAKTERSDEISTRRQELEAEVEATMSGRSTSPTKRPGSSSRMSMYEARPSPNASPEKQKIPDRSEDTPKKYSSHVQAPFKFSLEVVDRRPQALPPNFRLEPPRLPPAANIFLEEQGEFIMTDAAPVKPVGSAAASCGYSGRALAEWMLVVNECQNFFERRRNEGVPTNRLVETPVLGVESFRRLG